MIKPIRDKHSVLEAVLTLYSTKKYSDFNKFEILKDELNYNKFERINSLQVTFQASAESDVVTDRNTQDDAGFRLSKINSDNKILKAVQFNSMPNSTFSTLSFHDLEYSRWLNFSKSLKRDSELIFEIQECDFEIISLLFVDRFILTGNDTQTLKSILTSKNDYLPKFFNVSSSNQLALNLWSEEDNISFYNEIKIASIQNNVDATVLEIRHNIFYHSEEIFSLKSLYENDSKYNSIIEKMHFSNKMFLRDILKKDVQSSIHLN